MRKFLVTCVCALSCSLSSVAPATAQFGPIRLIQMGMTPEDTFVEIESAYVMALTSTGVFLSEHPHQNYCGIWAHLGEGYDLIIGDFIDVGGDYVEIEGLSVLEVADSDHPDAGWDWQAYGVVINMNTMTAAELMNYPEAWESCRIKIDTWMTVTSIEGDGEWIALADDGAEIRFDDFWYNAATVQVGHRYESVLGMWYYGGGNWKLEVFATGITPDDPAPNEVSSWGGVKALFR